MSQSKPKPFVRGLSERQMKGLQDAMKSPSHWWKDLLSLWRPSGHETGEYGLRLAIRDGYLNFYRRGQSVARVAFSKGGEPHLSVHAKYVVSDLERKLPNLRYARLKTTEITHADGLSRSYDGIDSLKAWIKVVDAHFTKEGDEKSLVDQLLGIAENSGVIDLEMALPAWERNRAAPRMDLVTIEDVSNRLTVVFGEVKRVRDSRIRCSVAAEPRVRPEVLKQLWDYEDYLSETAHRDAISEAYKATAKGLVQLNEMANAVRGELKLGDTVIAAAGGRDLTVAKRATLVVMCTGKFSSDHWLAQRKVLDQQGAKVVELSRPMPMNLGAHL